MRVLDPEIIPDAIDWTVNVSTVSKCIVTLPQPSAPFSKLQPQYWRTGDRATGGQ